MNQAQKLQQLDYMRYVRLLWRWKWFVLVPAIVFPLVAGLMAMRMPDRFRSTTLILVQPQKVPDRFVPTTVTSRIQDRLQTISQQIFSRTRLEKIIKEFGLFKAQQGKLAPEEIVARMRRRITLQVHRKDSFRLSYEDPDPRVAMLVTSKLASLFIEENLKVREQQALGTSQFLADEIANYREKIRALESSIMDFKRKHMNELPSQLASNQARLSQLQNRLQMNTDTLNNAENRRLQLQQQLAEIERRVEESRSQRRASSAGMSISDRLAALLDRQDAETGGELAEEARLQAAELQLKQARARIDDLLLRYTPKHPEVVAARAVAARLEEQVRAERAVVEQRRREFEEKRKAEQARQASTAAPPPEPEPQAPPAPKYPPIYDRLKADLQSIETEIAQIREQNRQIERQIEMFQARIAAVPARQLQLQQLSEDYDNLKTVLESLVNKKLQADMSASLERKQKGEQFKVLDPANLPKKPYAPNRLRMVLLAVVLGFGVGAGLVLGLDLLCPGVRTRNELKAVLGVPVFGLVTEIVTPERVRTRRKVRLATATGVVLVLATGALVVHVRVKPLPEAVRQIYTQVKSTHWTTLKDAR